MEIAGYKILNEIAQGGMASVYKGYQLSLKRDVAIKTLSKELVNKKGFSTRFNRESLIIARLSNPYIIPIIERGISDKSIPYYIMEYIEGTDLKIAMEKAKLDFNQKLDISIQICKALSYAHKNGVIHRDIKPANILLDSEGNAKVMDFGIAQYYSEDIASQKTQMGDMMGTLAYMSPEQHKSASFVSYKSDLYSLGVLMYKLFTQCDPLGRFKTPHELDHKIPIELDKIIVQCLETEPDNRPDSANTIKNTLLMLLRGAHLQTEQKQRASTGINNLVLLDIIKEEGRTNISLYENTADKTLMVINKRPISYPGLSESKLLSSLKHKNIVNIIGTSEGQHNYIIVMEYNTGGTLKERLLTPSPWSKFLIMAKEIIEGVLFAHNNHIIHGNIRPSNILFDNKDTLKLTNFGLRDPDKVTKQRKSYYKITGSNISIQSDIYALGIIFYQMITLQFPILKDKSYNNNKLFRQIPVKLQQLIIKMLETDSRQRYSSCTPILAIIDELLAENEATQLQQEPNSKPHKPARKKINKLYVLMALMLLLFAFLINFYATETLDLFNNISAFILDLFTDSEVEPAPNYIEF